MLRYYLQINNLEPGPGTWNLEPGAWNLEPGTSCPVLGSRFQVPHNAHNPNHTLTHTSTLTGQWSPLTWLVDVRYVSLCQMLRLGAHITDVWVFRCSVTIGHFYDVFAAEKHSVSFVTRILIKGTLRFCSNDILLIIMILQEFLMVFNRFYVFNFLLSTKCGRLNWLQVRNIYRSCLLR